MATVLLCTTGSRDRSSLTMLSVRARCSRRKTCGLGLLAPAPLPVVPCLKLGRANGVSTLSSTFPLTVMGRLLLARIPALCFRLLFAQPHRKRRAYARALCSTVTVRQLSPKLGGRIHRRTKCGRSTAEKRRLKLLRACTGAHIYTPRVCSRFRSSLL